MPAARALNPSREATAIEQQDHLAVSVERRLNLLTQFLANGAEAFAATKIDAQVDRRHVRQRSVGNTIF